MDEKHHGLLSQMGPNLNADFTTMRFFTSCKTCFSFENIGLNHIYHTKMYEFNDLNYKEASDMIPGTQYVLLNISFPYNLYGATVKR